MSATCIRVLPFPLGLRSVTAVWAGIWSTAWTVSLLCLPALGHAGWLFGPDDEQECVAEYAMAAEVGRLVPAIRARCTEAFDAQYAEVHRTRKLCEASGLSTAKHVELMSVVVEECARQHPDPICDGGKLLDPFRRFDGCVEPDYLSIDPYWNIHAKGETWSGVGDDGYTPAKRRSEVVSPDQLKKLLSIVEGMQKHPAVDHACEVVRSGVASRLAGTRVELTGRGGMRDVVGCSLSFRLGVEKGAQVVFTTTRSGTLYIYQVSQ